MEQLGGTYDPESKLTLWDQILLCESLVESTPIISDDLDGRTILQLKDGDKRSGSVMRCNGSCERTVNTWLTQSKHDAITELKRCNYRTNPKIIAGLLDDIFSDYQSDSGHWFSVAQRWPPRRIYLVLKYLIKLENPGHVTVRNPAAYFTSEIRHRAQRKHPKGKRKETNL